ncbi:Rus Holliday junction resolvase [uncultured Caudovirales phage]|jgi:crossover junction endodeoxyribonuclease RusA|uniref:Rus Holliday junction resolvase n=1 Tax=uncultured Caudovirales phage TaxID=2100421 RepID=A0A6J5PQX9_9CAUD|nr:Rus Holliday junction resolvase [uncultured Caudovirales phage]
MSKQHTIVIPNRPTPKGRPRLGRRGRVFTPVKTLEAEALVRGAYLMSDGPVFEGPVWLRIEFTPTSMEITVGESTLEVSKLRGDIDNYVKTVMDGLNGAAWADDKQVHLVEAWKA